jgi:site-specific recombinase XerD
MSSEQGMPALVWDRFERISGDHVARSWMKWQLSRGLAQNTIDAYARALERYLRFLETHRLSYNSVTRTDVGWFIRDLFALPGHLSLSSGQLVLTVVRLFHGFLVEEGIRSNTPIARGDARHRGLIPQYHSIPWIPTETQWLAILNAAKSDSWRNRVMLALGYDAGLRREELCGLNTDDIDPAHRLIRIRASHTKGRRERIVPYTPAASGLYSQYLIRRRSISSERGGLFLSESPRNFGNPVSIWTWSKAVRALAKKANVPFFSTHTLRHLCLTDLARSGWDIHDIATFAGHRSIDTTMTYIHLSGRDLGIKLARTLDGMHAQRLAFMAEKLDDRSDFSSHKSSGETGGSF